MPDFSEIEEESDKGSSQTSQAEDVKSKKKRGDFWRGVGLCLGLLIGLQALAVPFVLQLIEFNMPSGKNLFYQRITITLPSVGIILLMIYFAFKRPEVARGMAAAFGVSIGLLLILFLIALMVFGIGCGGFGGC